MFCIQQNLCNLLLKEWGSMDFRSVGELTASMDMICIFYSKMRSSFFFNDVNNVYISSLTCQSLPLSMAFTSLHSSSPLGSIMMASRLRAFDFESCVWTFQHTWLAVYRNVFLLSIDILWEWLDSLLSNWNFCFIFVEELVRNECRNCNFTSTLQKCLPLMDSLPFSSAWSSSFEALFHWT